jgi:hypothetical protein
LVSAKERNLRFGRVLGGVFLEGFPLSHEVADFPHQRLMAIDQFSGALAVVVKAGRGHRGLELLHARLALGNTAFQVGNTLLQRFEAALPFLSVGIDLLALFPRELGRFAG